MRKEGFLVLPKKFKHIVTTSARVSEVQQPRSQPRLINYALTKIDEFNFLGTFFSGRGS